MMLLDDVIYGGNSLLYNVDYDAMSQVLNPNRKKIEAKGVKSVSQRVAALSQYLDEPYRNLDIFEFKDLMIKKIFNVDDLKDVNRYIMTDKDWEQVDELIKTRYKNWEWTYGLSPRYEYNRDARLAIGTINFSLAIENQRIEKIKISGDFFAKKDLLELEKALIGTKMTHEDLLKAFNDADLQSYFFNEIKPEEVVKIILDEE
ncbi:bacterial lipoate ligase family protein [Mycoplasma mycoides subsp. mycoides]|nr:bacterial lipoate ligase family protein [Mycoplasma mycoides subsp. mycoides]